jgi:hypothetical protein
VGPAADPRLNHTYQNSIQIDLGGNPNHRSAINTRRSQLLTTQSMSTTTPPANVAKPSPSAVHKSQMASVKASNAAAATSNPNNPRQPNFIANSANTTNAAHLLLNNTASLLHSTQSVPGNLVLNGSNASPNTLRRSTRSSGNGVINGATGNVLISTNANLNTNSSSPAKRYK